MWKVVHILSRRSGVNNVLNGLLFLNYLTDSCYRLYWHNIIYCINTKWVKYINVFYITLFNKIQRQICQSFFMWLFLQKNITVQQLTFWPCFNHAYLWKQLVQFKVSGFVNLLRPMNATSVVIVGLVTPTLLLWPDRRLVIAKPCIGGLW